jgi:flagellar hook assembly protein FlgD
MPGTGPCVTAVNPIISDNAWITVSPNPFFEEVDFAIATQKTGKVEISILNVNGRRIASISRQNYGDDMIHIYWDGRDASGNNLSSGIYLYTITIGGEMIKTGKLVKTE